MLFSVKVGGEMKIRGDLTTTTPETITNKVLAGKEVDGEM
jgi:hypothetical protein